jgi:cyclophilin family peptidyl-prolyl cis-trans isomerase
VVSQSQPEAAIRRPLAPMARAAWRLAPLCTAALLSACGGGDTNTGAPTVTSISALASVLREGVQTSVIVRGSNLSAGNVALTGCSASTMKSQSPFSVIFDCTVGAAADVAVVVNGQEVASRLPIPRVDAITQVTASPLRFGQLTQFRVTGHGLDQKLSPISDACNEIIVSSVTSSLMEFDCFVSGVAGNVGVQASDKTLVGSPISISAPTKPQVTIAIEDNTTTPATLREVTVELDSYQAPGTVYNFLRYANYQLSTNQFFYDSTIFHRVIGSAANQSFQVIQGGLFVGKSANAMITEDERLAFLGDGIRLESTAETGLSNIAGTIAMARQADPNTDSAQSQFYFNTVDNSAVFDYASEDAPGYAVFGRVIGNNDLNTLTTLSSAATETITQTNADGTTTVFANVPVKNLVIKSVRQTQ